MQRGKKEPKEIEETLFTRKAEKQIHEEAPETPHAPGAEEDAEFGTLNSGEIGTI